MPVIEDGYAVSLSAIIRGLSNTAFATEAPF
jgi:hypothetical protein